MQLQDLSTKILATCILNLLLNGIDYTDIYINYIPVCSQPVDICTHRTVLTYI